MYASQIINFWRKIFKKKLYDAKDIIDFTEENSPDSDTEKYQISLHERASILLKEDPELYKAVLDHYEGLIWNRMKNATIFEEKLLKKESENWLRKVVGPENLTNKKE